MSCLKCNLVRGPEMSLYIFEHDPHSLRCKMDSLSALDLFLNLNYAPLFASCVSGMGTARHLRTMTARQGRNFQGGKKNQKEKEGERGGGGA